MNLLTKQKKTGSSLAGPVKVFAAPFGEEYERGKHKNKLGRTLL